MTEGKGESVWMSDALRAAYAAASNWQEGPQGGPQAVPGGTAAPAQRGAPRAVPAPSQCAAGAPGDDDAAVRRELAEERAAIMAEAGDVPLAEIVAYCLRTYGVRVRVPSGIANLCPRAPVRAGPVAPDLAISAPWAGT